MLFFIELDELQEFPVVRDAFVMICKKKLEINYYCSLERFIVTAETRLEYRDKLREMNSLIARLYELVYPKEPEHAAVVLRALQEELDKLALKEEPYEITIAEAEAVL